MHDYRGASSCGCSDTSSRSPDTVSASRGSSQTHRGEHSRACNACFEGARPVRLLTAGTSALRCTARPAPLRSARSPTYKTRLATWAARLAPSSPQLPARHEDRHRAPARQPPRLARARFRSRRRHGSSPSCTIATTEPRQCHACTSEHRIGLPAQPGRHERTRPGCRVLAAAQQHSLALASADAAREERFWTPPFRGASVGQRRRRDRQRRRPIQDTARMGRPAQLGGIQPAADFGAYARASTGMLGLTRAVFLHVLHREEA
jgi:hypothetical protein